MRTVEFNSPLDVDRCNDWASQHAQPLDLHPDDIAGTALTTPHALPMPGPS
jgi:hypothetical protein